MALVCTTITNWVGKHVITPVNTWVAKQQNQQKQVTAWVSQQQQQCNQYPWWDPRGWWCWFITVLVQVLVWIWILVTVFVQALVWIWIWILVPIVEVTCGVIAGFIWLVFLSWSTAAISVVSWGPWDWGKKWFWSPFTGTFTLVEKSSIGVNGQTGAIDYEYTFICNCHPWQKITITIQATNDDDAATYAEEICNARCQ
jgi:hypothetical protein